VLQNAALRHFSEGWLVIRDGYVALDNFAKNYSDNGNLEIMSDVIYFEVNASKIRRESLLHRAKLFMNFIINVMFLCAK